MGGTEVMTETRVIMIKVVTVTGTKVDTIGIRAATKKVAMIIEIKAAMTSTIKAVVMTTATTTNTKTDRTTRGTEVGVATTTRGDTETKATDTSGVAEEGGGEITSEEVEEGETSAAEEVGITGGEGEAGITVEEEVGTGSLVEVVGEGGIIAEEEGVGTMVGGEGDEGITGEEGVEVEGMGVVVVVVGGEGITAEEEVVIMGVVVGVVMVAEGEEGITTTMVMDTDQEAGVAGEVDMGVATEVGVEVVIATTTITSPTTITNTTSQEEGGVADTTINKTMMVAIETPTAEGRERVIVTMTTDVVVAATLSTAASTGAVVRTTLRLGRPGRACTRNTRLPPATTTNITRVVAMTTMPPTIPPARSSIASGMTTKMKSPSIGTGPLTARPLTAAAVAGVTTSSLNHAVALRTVAAPARLTVEAVAVSHQSPPLNTPRSVGRDVRVITGAPPVPLLQREVATRQAATPRTCPSRTRTSTRTTHTEVVTALCMIRTSIRQSHATVGHVPPSMSPRDATPRASVGGIRRRATGTYER